MDLLKMIAELQTEKQRLDEAIQALERLSQANSRPKGRSPRWPKEAVEASEEQKSEVNPE